MSILVRVDRYPIKAVANPKPIIFVIAARTIFKKTFLCSSLFIHIFLSGDRDQGMDLWHLIINYFKIITFIYYSINRFQQHFFMYEREL